MLIISNLVFAGVFLQFLRVFSKKDTYSNRSATAYVIAHNEKFNRSTTIVP
jgi:hypothetical protein